ncbi:MAG: GIY-YIG nuclease family protein [Geminicoccaceae bacterium]|nr:GIY-YIG nuclease family protein [Geminicoccaceae bacterium]
MCVFHVCILASHKHSIFYVGVTSDLPRRLAGHRSDAAPGFTRRYAVKRLVYVEPYDDIATARRREHQLKHWRRDWKIALIDAHNPDWRDMAEELS